MSGATAEGIIINPAPLHARMTAAFLDGVFLITCYGVVFSFAKPLTFPSMLCLAINLFIFLGYHVGITRSQKWGASPGKWLMGLRVVDDKYARPLSNNRAVGRAFAMLLPLIPFLYFYYVWWPNILVDRYEYRVGTGKMWARMQKGEHLTPAEQVRWDDFQKYVQQPSKEMEFVALKMTGAALGAWMLIMVFHPRRKTVHDMISETMVVRADDVSNVSAPDELPYEPPAL